MWLGMRDRSPFRRGGRPIPGGTGPIVILPAGSAALTSGFPPNRTRAPGASIESYDHPSERLGIM
ncbi:hypothetical protein GCM10009738_24190 [Kitasatospora viridis]